MTNKCTQTGNPCGTDTWPLKIERPQCHCQYMYLAGYNARKLEEEYEKEVKVGEPVGFINGLRD